jgi:hypothetical protein
MPRGRLLPFQLLSTDIFRIAYWIWENGRAYEQNWQAVPEYLRGRNTGQITEPLHLVLPVLQTDS